VAERPGVSKRQVSKRRQAIDDQGAASLAEIEDPDDAAASRSPDGAFMWSLAVPELPNSLRSRSVFVARGCCPQPLGLPCGGRCGHSLGDPWPRTTNTLRWGLPQDHSYW